MCVRSFAGSSSVDVVGLARDQAQKRASIAGQEGVRRDQVPLSSYRVEEHGSIAQTPLSSQDLHVSLLDQTLDVSLADKELAVLRQIQTAVLGLDLSRVAQDADVDEDFLRGLQTAGEIDVGPLAFILREQLAVLVDILLLFRGERRSVGRVGVSRGSGRTSTEDVLAVPDHLLEFVCAGAVVGQETSLVAAHAEVVDHERARGGGIFGRVERGFNLRAIAGLRAGRAEAGEDLAVLAVEVADFFGHGLDGRAGVGWQVREVLDAFGVHDELVGLLAIHFYRSIC